MDWPTSVINEVINHAIQVVFRVVRYSPAHPLGVWCTTSGDCMEGWTTGGSPLFPRTVTFLIYIVLIVLI